MFIDSHCHLDFPEFEKEGIDEVLSRAANNNVDHMVTICTEIAKFPNILEIAKKYQQIDCTIGTHPHNAENEAEQEFDLDYIVTQIKKHEEIVGIGETGLDYFYNNSPKEIQLKHFRKHLQASVETGLPTIVHTRDADTDTAKILSEEHANGKLTGVMHCFSSGRKLAEQAIELGFYISLSGIITFKKAEELREIVKDIPLDRILIETDSPYLAPVPHRGKTNEPAFVIHTAEKLAEIKNLTTKEIAKATTENFYRLFKRVKNKKQIK